MFYKQKYYSNMPPKSSNKKLTAGSMPSWYHCEKCDVHITSKEREKHEQKCPINDGQSETDNGEHLEYLRRGTLYTGSYEKRKFDIEELKEMKTKYINNLIFISEGAIRLAGWHIGQQVVIKSYNAITLVRMVWPIPEKFLTTIFVSEEDFTTYWTSYKEHSIRIEAVPVGQPKFSKTLLLQIQTSNQEDEPLDSQQLKDVDRLLKLELRNLSFTSDSVVYFNFFNKILILKIIYWSAVCHTNDALSDLEKSINNLNINENSRDIVFKVTNSTAIEVSSENIPNSDDESDDVSKYAITTKDVGALNKQFEIIEEAIDFALGLRKIPNGVKISRGLLIYGSSGCGKTMICEAMCSRLLHKQELQQISFKPLILQLNTSELFSKFLGETEKNLTAYFDKVYKHYPRPSLIIVEDVQNLCPKHETNEIVKRVSVAFLNLMDTLTHKREAQKCFLLATTCQIDLLNPSIRRCGRLDCEVEVAPPTPDGRQAILKCLLKKVDNHNLSLEEVQQVSQVTHGFVGADLANLLYTATLKSIQHNTNDAPVKLQAKDLINALSYVKPSAMREVLIECPNVKWSDIGGQDELKLKLKQAIEWPLKHSEQFRRLGIKPPRGLLMYGPPGCSKTMIAKALATESQLNFISIKGPELFSMWVGESERAVREVFRKARQVAPAVIFFDEIDAIGGERSDASCSGSGSSVKERVLTQLLTELDGFEPLDNVTIVAATNRPDMIDKALLRPGRIDRIIYVGLPDARARQEIFHIKLKKMPIDEDVNLLELVQRTNGYSGAEIQAVCHEAALKTLEESFDAACVTWSQFEYALKVVLPRTSPDLLRLYEEYGNKS